MSSPSKHPTPPVPPIHPHSKQTTTTVLKNWWSKVPALIKGIIYLYFLALYIGIVTSPKWYAVSGGELARSGLTTLGQWFASSIIKAGSTAETLCLPMMWIGALYWAFVICICGPRWFSKYMKRKFG